ncbi:hypothetical protein Pmani_011671 [Petrolisthes manimaculis]|uniref:PX domain-containing protein n=1 Tax=Petrolisthes manimaculis TaxID=1843537 RepID=A0AAE1Q213_9EUCA|nr:hypothetical protein Pmani_011671 [Petrolisthes manimaculis]
MADSREPPPLFNDDDDSHKDDENDDLFSSAVQSPVSEQTTPEDSRRQAGGDDPLSSPPPAASFTPDPPAGVQPDLIESSEEPTEASFSSVPLEQPAGGDGAQQVSTLEEHPNASPNSHPSPSSSPVPFPPSLTTTIMTSETRVLESLSSDVPTFTTEEQSAVSEFTSQNGISSSDAASAPQPSPPVAAEKPQSSPLPTAYLDLGMTLPQEQLPQPTANLVDVPPVAPAAMSSPVDQTDETTASSYPNIPITDILADVDASDGQASPASTHPGTTTTTTLSDDDFLATEPSSLHAAPAFLGDGDTIEVALDETAKEVSLEEEANEPDLFDTAAAPKLQLNQDLGEQQVPASSILPPMGAPISPPVAPTTPTATPNLTPSITPAAPTPITPVPLSRSSPEQIESESGDEFLQITVSDPQKIGDGMSSYMAYKITTRTNVSFFRKKNWSVMRRFSDFLGLHRKLVEKHLHSGRIIPPAPEKSAIGTTKIKLGSDKNADSGSADFIEKRRASLERYMNRTGAHSILRADPDFREFLELDAELPRATQTSALSGAGVLRLLNKVGETVNKMTFKMDESDQWFEEKTQQVESLDAQLRKLHSAMEGLVWYRRELATNTAAFAKSCAVLSSVEEHSSLSRALHQLSESTERTHTIHHAQGDADFYILSENTKDYIQLIAAVKDVFHERVKTFQTWQHSQATLAKKREAKAKAELAGRMDKVQQAQEEVAEWEGKVERSQEEFERISKAIKKEMEQFDVVRVQDFKDMVVKYLEALMTSQQQIIKVWETFIPEAKAIS